MPEPSPELLEAATPNVKLANRTMPSQARRGLEQAGAQEVRALWALVDDGRRYSVLVSRDPIGGKGLPDDRWHISVAGESDVPPWRDLVAIGHKIRPGIVFVVGVPPRSHWMSVHPHCLHLWESKDANLSAQWMFERQGATPS